MEELEAFNLRVAGSIPAAPTSFEAPRPEDRDIDDWCRVHLEAGVRRQFMRAGYLSAVVGVELTDGRAAVVKVRSAHPRLAGCYEAQSALWAAGFPCPEPLVPPTPLGAWAVSAETFVPGGEMLPSSGREARPFAEALALLVRLAPAPDQLPSLDPKPPWNAWDHREGGRWPAPDDCDRDLNTVEGPVWLDEGADAARSWLQDGSGRTVVGHGDWYTGNLRWAGDRLLAVHDWDSMLADREAVVVGFASAVYCTVSAGTDPTVQESAQFIATYEAARGMPLSDRERADAWAAGLWMRAFDAKKQLAKREPMRSLTAPEARERRNCFDRWT